MCLVVSLGTYLVDSALSAKRADAIVRRISLPFSKLRWIFSAGTEGRKASESALGWDAEA